MSFRCEMCGEEVEGGSRAEVRHTIGCFIRAIIELIRLRAENGRVKE